MIEVTDPMTLWAGLALLLGGWILYWMTLTLTGAVLFGVGSMLAASLLTSILEIDEGVRMGIQVGAALVGALAGAFVFRLVHKIAFFTLGTAVGLVAMLGLVALGRGLDWDWAESRNVVALVVPVGTVITGLIAMAMDSVVIAAASSIIGSLLVMEGLGWPYDGLPVLGLIPLGLVVQLWLTDAKRSKRKSSDADDEDD